ncbi:hypothetical protein PQR21_31640 [Paraburkholderia nemoris]|uniref:hypothetical protein n=1 Tax=Paraburkholderia nemoris TaxID=2793076 RepID=UPI0038B7E083
MSENVARTETNVPSSKKTDHEGPLIACFQRAIKTDAIFGIKEMANIGTDSPLYSDVEYVTTNDEYLVIEAKSHESKDAYNTRHKIFGQLLKEHGKKNPLRDRYTNSLALGILIPKDETSSGKSNTRQSGYQFYRNGYRDIPHHLFRGFGELTKTKYVFVCSLKNETVDVYSWTGFHLGDAPIFRIG